MANRSGLLLLFDVDGTLTAPRRVIADATRSFLLERVLPVATVGLVGGSDFSKISEQMGGEETLARLDHVFCENGLVHYSRGELVSEHSMLETLGERKIQSFINFCFSHMATLELPAKRGNFIEFRKGMINVSPIGRSCTLKERDQFVEYDTKYGIRDQFVQAMKTAFPDAGLQFSLGGQISVDVFPVGWDKTFCLKSLGHHEVIHFFGDKTDPGGNDHEIYGHPATVGHRVASPEDTVKQVAELLLGLQRQPL